MSSVVRIKAHSHKNARSQAAVQEAVGLRPQAAVSWFQLSGFSFQVSGFKFQVSDWGIGNHGCAVSDLKFQI
jgi:hypothetical protein